MWGPKESVLLNLMARHLTFEEVGIEEPSTMAFMVKGRVLESVVFEK